MLFIFEDGTTKTFEIGQKVVGLKHNSSRPILCILSIKALNDFIFEVGPIRATQYVHTSVASALSFNGNILLR